MASSAVGNPSEEEPRNVIVDVCADKQQQEDLENEKGKSEQDGKKDEATVDAPDPSSSGEASETKKEETSENQTSSENKPRETCKKQEVKALEVEAHHETEEVIERLLDVKGLEQSVSGLWGWMSGGVTKVAEKANQVAQQASQVAEKASQQASIVAEQAEKQAKIVAEKAQQQAAVVAEHASKAKAMATQQASELAATVSKTMEDKSTTETLASNPPMVPAASLPWETAHPERRAEARERVLKLSMDDHTFTIPPPKEANYVYDAAAREPYAARMLDTDALLSAKRFKLVPKVVDEQDFWRNYFYRVDLILNALGMPSAVQEPTGKANSQKDSKVDAGTNAAAEANHPDWEEEMRKEIAAAEASHMEDAVKDDENFDMLEDDLEFEDDGELEKSINDLKLG